MRGKLCGATLLAAAGATLAQAEIFIEVSNPDPQPGETITLTLQAGFPSGDYAIAGVAGDLLISSSQGTLSNPRLLRPMDGPGTEPGVIMDGAVEGIIAGQLNFPPTGGIYADPTNPMPYWSIDFTVDPVLSGPIVLEARTRTTRYDVYIAMSSSTSASRLGDLIEGEARVLVARDCAVDFDGDGLATVFDFLYFFNLFEVGDLLSDFDGDGELTLFDFIEYQNQFMAGC
ncbi:MAG: GC-type dockerin domain-anchored protein [Phycisphaerales bacterium JB060]